MALLCSACLETSGLLRRIAKTQAEDACVCLAHWTQMLPFSGGFMGEEFFFISQRNSKT
jgi:hypothetical protein